MARRADRWADLEALVTTADEGSFTAAARKLETSPSAVSRAVLRLEQSLGVQLVRRTTRRLAFTQAGLEYLDKVRDLLTGLDEADRHAQGRSSEISGRIRLSVPTTWGHFRAIPLLAHFAEKHPAVDVDLRIENRNTDLVADGVDLAVRLGELADSGLIARPLERARPKLVASASYIARSGEPQTLDDLGGHRCIPFLMPSTGRVLPWALTDDDRVVPWSPPETWRVAEDVLGCVGLAEQGLGITQTYAFIADPLLAAGRLVEVLPQHAGATRTFSLVYLAEAFRRPAVQALIDHFLEPHPA